MSNFLLHKLESIGIRGIALDLFQLKAWHIFCSISYILELICFIYNFHFQIQNIFMI